MVIDNLAPIALFVFNRLDNTKQTVEALKKNKLADQSELFIYSDGPRGQDTVAEVNNVRQYIKTITGFKRIKIIEHNINLGLATSIITGVTKIVNKYGKIIVLEDDLITSKYFLKFMNEALEIYKDNKKIWHISGWNYPIHEEKLNRVFFGA